MVNIMISIAVLALCAIAEYLHYLRCKKLEPLSFGPDGKVPVWTKSTPFLRIVGASILCWGLLTLMYYRGHENSKAAKQKVEEPSADEIKHVVVIYDASPSMTGEDSGSEGSQTRMGRAQDILKSMMERITAPHVRYSMIAVFTEARPVVVETKDRDVLLNIMELPLHKGFESGKTKLIDGLTSAFDLAAKWPPQSTTVIMITDGDTMPSSGLPRKPSSIKDFIVAGVGSSRGFFIDGHQSRQDTSSLRGIASRVSGVYQDANIKHISTKSMGELAGEQDEKESEWNLKHLALLFCGVGASLLMLLPLLLEYFGFDSFKHESTERELNNIKGVSR